MTSVKWLKYVHWVEFVTRQYSYMVFRTCLLFGVSLAAGTKHWIYLLLPLRLLLWVWMSYSASSHFPYIKSSWLTLYARRLSSEYQWCCWESCGINWAPKSDAKRFFFTFGLPCIFKLWDLLGFSEMFNDLLRTRHINALQGKWRKIWMFFSLCLFIMWSVY